MRTQAQPMTDPDALEIASARQGDSDAYDRLVRRHARAAGRLAVRLLGNREDAEDVVQESFVKAFQNLDKFRGDSSFKTWLLHITLNLAQDHLRRRQRRRQSGSDLGLDPFQAAREVPAEAAGPVRAAQARDQVKQLRQAVDQLPPRQKTALLLKVYEDLSYVEVAEVLGTSVNAARVYLSLARQSLRRRFDAPPPEGGAS